jgi:erythritol kinase
MRGIGLAAQAGSAILADRHTGRALTAMQLWSDTRPCALLPEIAARKRPSYWRRLSGLDGPGAGLARIEWLKRRRPTLFGPGTIYVGVGELLYFHLTGQWRQDVGNALQQGCYSLGGNRLADGPLLLVGEGRSRVAPLRRGHQTHPLCPAGAKLLGLPEGIPVAGPYFDHEAGYLSVAGGPGRAVQCSLGTAWVGSFVQPRGSPPPAHFQLLLPNPTGGGWLVVRVMLAGTVTWDWALHTFASPRRGRALRVADEVFHAGLLPPPGLVALPWLTRPNPLSPRQVGAGGLLGISAHTTGADALRAVAAGMALEFARLFRPVVDAGLVDRVVLSGGASRGWYFRELLGGLFAPLPVARVADEDPGAVRGTLYAFSRPAARCPTRRLPRPAKARLGELRRRYEEYCATCRTLARALPRGAGLLGDPAE